MFSIDPYRERLRELCIQYAVKRMDLVGSAARDDFDEEHSDIDILVEFEGVSRLFDRYFELKASLEKDFQRRVDLIQPAAITNYAFQRTIDADRIAVYEAHP